MCQVAWATPASGGAYLAKSAEDGEWYRATVLDVSTDATGVTTTSLRYLDYGNTEHIQTQVSAALN